jgi:hypothetical protein
MAPADHLTAAPEEKKVTVEARFCPGTVGNLASNPRIVLVVWESKTDRGFQVSGDAESVEDIALLNGFVPGIESMTPHGKKRLHIRVKKVMAFQHSPHTDKEE